MGIPVPTSIGGQLVPRMGIPPQSSVAATINGTGFDRTLFESCSLVAKTGTSSPAPTSYIHTFKLQDSADNVTFADYQAPLPGGGTAVPQAIFNGTPGTQDNTVQNVSVNLLGARQYIRVSVTLTFVGGSSPATPIDATVVLGGAVTAPTAGS